MASLKLLSPKNTYKGLVTFASNDGLSSSLQAVQDGQGATTPLSLSTTQIALAGKVWPTTGMVTGAQLTVDSSGNLAWTVASSTGSLTTQNNTWTKAQRSAVAAATYAATTTLDFSASNNFAITLTGNVTMALPTNLVAGQSGVIAITQDATGNRAVTWATGWVGTEGDRPALSTAANAIDMITYYVISSTKVFISVSTNLS